MAYNSRLMARARSELARIREDSLREHERRVAIAYRKIPELEQIDLQLRSQMPRLASLILSGAAPAEVAALKDSNLSLQQRRAELLVENGYPSDWLEELHSCKLCGDTGDAPSGICSCLKELYNRALTEDLSTLLHTGNESFANFNLSLYPEKNRDHMRGVCELCMQFSEFFPDVENLLLYGAPGLGKTYLSACIARAVAESGFSVVYDTCSSCVSAFEILQFRKTEEYDDASRLANGILGCDLLILDDLGTEFSNPFAVSSLYNVINTRINEKKPTIISTNLSFHDLENRYTPALCSRIENCFQCLQFEGNDIRKILKESSHG